MKYTYKETIVKPIVTKYNEVTHWHFELDVEDEDGVSLSMDGLWPVEGLVISPSWTKDGIATEFAKWDSYNKITEKIKIKLDFKAKKAIEPQNYRYNDLLQNKKDKI